MSHGATLEVRGFSKSFGVGDRPLFASLDWRLTAGTATCLVGDNGVGKSVLAMCICGLIPPDTGDLYFGGCRVQRINRKTLKAFGIEYIPQRLPAPAGLTAVDVLALQKDQGAFVRDRALLRQVEMRCKALHFDLTFDLRQSVAALQAAELRQLYLLRAVMSDAVFLFFDEPADSLDEAERASLSKALNALLQAGKGVVLIAHPEQGAVSLARELGPVAWYELANGGLRQLGAAPEPRYEFISPGERLRPKSSGWTWTLAVGTVEQVLSPGSIVVVRGPTTREFDAFAATFARACTDVIGPFWSSIRESGRPTVRYIAFDGIESQVAGRLDLLENCLVDRWSDESVARRWGLIDREAACEDVFEPVRSFVELNQRDPAFLADRLSGGNRQRLLVGRVLAAPVDLLIGCGITRGLDGPGVALVGRRLEQRVSQGAAALLFTTVDGAESQIANSIFEYSYRDGAHRIACRQ